MMFVRTLAAAAVAILAAGCSHAQDYAPGSPPPLHWEKESLVIQTSTGAHRFTVEIADDNDERERGLMYRIKMAQDAGMLFEYPRDQNITMWMENTHLPLDMVFITADGTVFDNVLGAVPFSRDFISSGGKVRAVLELNAGTVNRIGLRRGDKVRAEFFGNAAP